MNNVKRLNVNDLLFILYPLTVVFEFYRLFGLSDNISISFIIGLVYFITSFPRWAGAIRSVLRERWFYFIFGYFLVEISVSIFYINLASSIDDIVNLTVFFNLVILVISYDHLNRKPYLFYYIMFCFLFSIALLGVLNFFGIGFEVDKGRLQSFNEDANSVGNKAFFGVFFASMLYKFYNNEKYFFWKFIVILFGFISFLVLIYTASRGPLLILILLTFIFILISSFSKLFKFVLFFIMFLLVINFGNISERFNLIIGQRLMMTVDYGQNGRDDIWKAAVNIFVDFPLGVGRSGFSSTMSNYLGYFMDSHNVFLYVSITSGVFGLILFLLFHLEMLKISSFNWKLKKTLLVLLVIGITLISTQAGGIINKKFLWFVYLVCLQSKILLNSNYLK